NTPAQAAREAQVVFACVGNDDDLRQVVLGEDGAFAGMEHDAVFVDHTTASADIARALSTTARDRGLHFIDAPVSGGESGAQNGTLTVMCGGDEDAFARVESVISCYARAVTLMGPVGAGQLTKMVNQLCIAGLIQSLSEGINFAINAGLDPKRVLAVITKGAAQSWQMENRGESMASGEFDFGFAVDWMRKDLMLCFEEARRNRSRLPVAALVDQFYAQVQARGGGRWDTSSLIHLLRNP
ncbi:MAG: NAD(P)-dependent oxidoreductase, partial [Gammaproteobacteria bacterium]|nr:NAD(P)-dependent oxidoreductase [Gammaproteobacteria bacterium]